jgi:hypothetical protein
MPVIAADESQNPIRNLIQKFGGMAAKTLKKSPHEPNLQDKIQFMLEFTFSWTGKIGTTTQVGRKPSTRSSAESWRTVHETSMK